MRIICESIESSFLIRCASSMTIYCHAIFLRADFSRRTISYEVTHTSQSLP